MRLEEFIEKYKDEWNYPYIKSDNWRKYSSKQDKTKPQLSVEWTIGGQTSGSCWDTGDSDPHHGVTADDEPELDGLDRILEEIAPGITYLEYKKLAKIMKTHDHTEHEYYGNYYEKRVKYVEAPDLYNALVSMGHIKEAE